MSVGGFTTYSVDLTETLILGTWGGRYCCLYIVGKLLVCFVAVLAGARLIRAFA